MKKKYQVFKINITMVNIFVFVLLALCILLLYFLFPDMLYKMLGLYNNNRYMLMLVPAIIFWSILHELLHAIGYIVNGADAKKITFGAELEKGVFYCLCKEERPLSH